MWRDDIDNGIAYKIEVSFMGGKLKLEESGKVTHSNTVRSDELRKAEKELSQVLRKVYELVLGRVGVGLEAVEENRENRAEPKAPGRKGDLPMTVLNVAEFLGVGRTVAYELVRRGEIRSFRVGHQLRVVREDLYRWIDEQREQSHGSEGTTSWGG